MKRCNHKWINTGKDGLRCRICGIYERTINFEFQGVPDENLTLEGTQYIPDDLWYLKNQIIENLMFSSGK
jgi:hypothetical protein